MENSLKKFLEIQYSIACRTNSLEMARSCYNSGYGAMQWEAFRTGEAFKVWTIWEPWGNKMYEIVKYLESVKN